MRFTRSEMIMQLMVTEFKEMFYFLELSVFFWCYLYRYDWDLEPDCCTHVNNVPKFLSVTSWKPDLYLQKSTGCQSCNLHLLINCGLEPLHIRATECAQIKDVTWHYHQFTYKCKQSLLMKHAEPCYYDE